MLLRSAHTSWAHRSVVTLIRCAFHPNLWDSEADHVVHQEPGGSKYPIFKDSGPKSHSGYRFWDQSPQNIGYLDPLGKI